MPAKGRRADWRPQPATPSGALQPDLVAKIKKLQEEMAATQAALEHELINVAAAGGAITITISGHQRVQSIKIDPALIDPNDPTMLEDALVAAINEAILASQEYSAKRLEAVTGELNINLPGLF
ncbi:MAG: YbaB/EbfC family nucleoid-associated protein [Thermoflexales bacterium]|nr:YbaB/EbfC family nucleoid-associated protein [Thermoflexales bacterium]MCS7323834.1 YbaB/EbfC family nucleoid-associated protein [Thermoflexales bacterium]MCX7938516.1 YbaB/EbfC family nucleoid-associated protein [Thermoflexales bacterium]MDW8054581.1 YbaB/EbfC family nucleoid-associated protein [Anaerolineae bacterium]MDW8292672.1 YbaB/EbfC family nucleoid-associated protein [Anaerolineae bacterium]